MSAGTGSCDGPTRAMTLALVSDIGCRYASMPASWNHPSTNSATGRSYPERSGKALSERVRSASSSPWAVIASTIASIAAVALDIVSSLQPAGIRRAAVFP